jgi:hypothetical protein
MSFLLFLDIVDYLCNLYIYCISKDQADEYRIDKSSI